MSYIFFWLLIGIGAAAAVGLGVYAIRKAVLAGRIASTERRVASIQAEVQSVGTRSVDRIDISAVTDTGLSTPIPRYTFDLEFWWTDNDGTSRHYGPETYTWPNDLGDVPPHIVKQWATELITQAVRWRLGIDEVPE